MFSFAQMMAPRMAVATSLAHFTPRPTWPLKSPTTTNACAGTADEVSEKHLYIK